MGVFNIFGSKSGFDPNKFEKELNTIAENINKTKQQLVKLKINKKSINKKLSLFTFIIYILIFFYSYISIPNSTIATNKIQRFLKGQSKFNFYLLIGFPLISILITKLINFIFKYLIKSQDSHLSILKQKHKLKIEELKKITKYNETNELINKYDDKPKPIPQQQFIPNLQQQQPKQPQNNNKSNKLRNQALKELHLSEDQLSSNQQSSISQQQIPQPQSTNPQQQSPNSPIHKRNLQDKLLDLFIGSDNSESIEQRYALICSHCFSHNGLAPPNCDDPNNVKYQCWKCGAMNGKGMLFDNQENVYDNNNNVNNNNDNNKQSINNDEKELKDIKNEKSDNALPEMIEITKHLEEKPKDNGTNEELSEKEAVPQIPPIESETKKD
ncbi:hypothetical protein KGF54_001351 [Candida jiufengensis]|uniref:uncharacterized protein n=1 Tax=Candida jiufengensis TaxID=497108 RepID=UPI0022244DE0|nr:uncharacterized protein KGF54_001351 [Candida jiufengensis]KAI5955849.1 hypothetical protein KGF54_001351 [Candida jiufengensis]